jgi:hypothetical protein
MESGSGGSLHLTSCVVHVCCNSQGIEDSTVPDVSLGDGVKIGSVLGNPLPITYLKLR